MIITDKFGNEFDVEICAQDKNCELYYVTANGETVTECQSEEEAKETVEAIKNAEDWFWEYTVAESNEAFGDKYKRI